MERQKSFRRRHNMPKPPLAERVKDHCRQFTAFMFSNVGIIILVALYMTSGASMFRAIEGDIDEKRTRDQNIAMAKLRGDLTFQLWNITLQLNNFNRSTYLKENTFTYQNAINQCTDTLYIYVVQVDLTTESDEFSADFMKRCDSFISFDMSCLHSENYFFTSNIGTLAFHDGWVGSKGMTSSTWTFPNGLLYSLTVITTIGYGNITPRTTLGKSITIFYAIVGMPLFLLYLSNIGDIMAKSFKWIYAKLCLCRICPGVAKRREARNRRKIRAMQRQLREDYEEDDDYSTEESVSMTSESSSSSKRTAESQMITDGTTSSTSESTQEDLSTVSVPISVCLMIMISYILFGAIIFLRWEESWKVLNGCYFCFISLSSIGFGDIIPGDKIFEMKGGVDDVRGVDIQFIICAVYLLLGMALIAMCFNLMQEQVINNIRAFKRGISRCFRCHRCKNHDID